MNITKWKKLFSKIKDLNSEHVALAGVSDIHMKEVSLLKYAAQAVTVTVMRTV